MNMKTHTLKQMYDNTREMTQSDLSMVFEREENTSSVEELRNAFMYFVCDKYKIVSLFLFYAHIHYIHCTTVYV